MLFASRYGVHVRLPHMSPDLYLGIGNERDIIEGLDLPLTNKKINWMIDKLRLMKVINTMSWENHQHDMPGTGNRKQLLPEVFHRTMKSTDNKVNERKPKTYRPKGNVTQ